MFKIVAEPKFTHPVEVQVPTDGGHETQSFKATFRVVDFDELSAIEAAGGIKAVCQKIVVHLDELVSEDGKTPVAYSDTIRDQLLAASYVRVAIYNSYVKACTKAKSGN